MKMIALTFCCVFALAAVTPVRAADTAGSASAAETVQAAQDKNGNPMTSEQYKKAYKAQLDARTQAVEQRLEARQAKWKKDKSEEATNGTGK